MRKIKWDKENTTEITPEYGRPHSHRVYGYREVGHRSVFPTILVTLRTTLTLTLWNRNAECVMASATAQPERTKYRPTARIKTNSRTVLYKRCSPYTTISIDRSLRLTSCKISVTDGLTRTMDEDHPSSPNLELMYTKYLWTAPSDLWRLQ